MAPPDSNLFTYFEIIPEKGLYPENPCQYGVTGAASAGPLRAGAKKIQRNGQEKCALRLGALARNQAREPRRR